MPRKSQEEFPTNDLRIDVYHKRPVGGWSVDQPKAVRVTHLPSGVWVEEFANRSVHINRAEALNKLYTVKRFMPQLFVVPEVLTLATLPKYKQTWDSTSHLVQREDGDYYKVADVVALIQSLLKAVS